MKTALFFVPSFENRVNFVYFMVEKGKA